jgi:hypothetical protein
MGSGEHRAWQQQFLDSWRQKDPEHYQHPQHGKEEKEQTGLALVLPFLRHVLAACCTNRKHVGKSRR